VAGLNKVFDKMGNFIREIGKRGQGPGEFAFPWGIMISPKQELPKFYPAFKSLSVDEKGRLFVCTFKKISEGKENYYDVFNSDGKYIAEISLRAKPRVWKSGKIYTIEENEEGFQVVKRYKVSWNY